MANVDPEHQGGDEPKDAVKAADRQRRRSLREIRLWFRWVTRPVRDPFGGLRHEVAEHPEDDELSQQLEIDEREDVGRESYGAPEPHGGLP